MAIAISIWLGFGMGIVIPLAFFTVEYSIERKEERKGNFITLTPFKNRRNRETGKIDYFNEDVDFNPRHGNYLKCAEVLITLASASLLFLALHSSELPRSGVPGVLLGMSMILLSLAVVYALLFMALLTYFYEMFLFNPNNFRAFHSSTIFTLGFSSFACFGLAYISLALVIAQKLSHSIRVAFYFLHVAAATGFASQIRYRFEATRPISLACPRPCGSSYPPACSDRRRHPASPKPQTQLRHQHHPLTNGKAAPIPLPLLQMLRHIVVVKF
jgi:hypothetical protein